MSKPVRPERLKPDMAGPGAGPRDRNRAEETLELIASIVAKTYAKVGDDNEIEDHEALGWIRDVLEESDEGIFERTGNTKLTTVKRNVKRLMLARRC